MSHGAEEVSSDVSVMNGFIDFNDEYWYNNKPGGSSIEGYDKIDKLKESIIEDYNLVEIATDIDNYTQIDFNIDCKERILLIQAWEDMTNIESDSITVTSSENEVLKSFVDEMKSNNYNYGEIMFEGSNDSGYVDNNITLDDSTTVESPSDIEDLCYEILTNFPGWEINEGSQGRFEFDFTNGFVELIYEQNMVDKVKVDFKLVGNF